jgi:hypothetical protein
MRTRTSTIPVQIAGSREGAQNKTMNGHKIWRVAADLADLR